MNKHSENEYSANELPAGVDRELDWLLGEWAEQAWLGVQPQEPGELRDMIVIRKEWGYEWWQQLFNRVPLQSAYPPFKDWAQAV
ncbi:hypothetical protein [Paenibacillus sacheonensis]|uniref:Uncharacterized protein n=1 Tax=Paenibacillus sacheonensis TaxID=742054 RepID=A0A7X5C2J9_9BACL|nr:hypothetical protein [Paenibacillus sacheonensis]MBM7567540.1 hypothetical protein [Paenibacillus sacheonensis]NBC71355.1 hypothetical protein [Paenibacillus sacheonensis]